MAPAPVRSIALAGAADRLAGGASALALESAELADTGHARAAHAAAVEAQAAILAADRALDELVDLEVERLLASARAVLDRP